MKRLLRAVSRNRLQGIEHVVAKKFESIAMKLIGPGGRSYGQLWASCGCGLRCGQHRVNAKLLNRVERNRQTNVRLLRLVDDIAGVDAVVGKIVVIAASAGESNRTLITTSGIDCAGSQHRQGCPISAIQWQLPGLCLLDASAEGVGSLIHLLGTGRYFNAFFDARYLKGCIQRARLVQGLDHILEAERFEALVAEARSEEHTS